AAGGNDPRPWHSAAWCGRATRGWPPRLRTAPGRMTTKWPYRTGADAPGPAGNRPAVHWRCAPLSPPWKLPCPWPASNGRQSYDGILVLIVKTIPIGGARHGNSPCFWRLLTILTFPFGCARLLTPSAPRGGGAVQVPPALTGHGHVAEWFVQQQEVGILQQGPEDQAGAVQGQRNRKRRSQQRPDGFRHLLAPYQQLTEIDHAVGEHADEEDIVVVTDGHQRQDVLAAAHDDIVQPSVLLQVAGNGLAQAEKRACHGQARHHDRLVVVPGHVDQVSVAGGQEGAQGPWKILHAFGQQSPDIPDDVGRGTCLGHTEPWEAISRAFIRARPRLVSMRQTTTATTFSFDSRRAKMCSRFLDETMISRK